MLVSLNIKNVAVIKSLEVGFHGGMTAFTGETGAGKSIIIDSINMILGARASRELVRYGTDKAVVQAVFDGCGEARELLEDAGIDCEEDEIIVTRTLTAEGKSTARINGSAVTLAQLREIADKLINIHGQHDNQALLNPDRHITFLDSFAASRDALDKYCAIYAESRRIKKQLSALEMDEKDRMQRIDLLEYQIKEISEAKLVAGEEEDLESRRELLENAEEIAEASETAYSNLYDMEEAQSAYDCISVAVNAIGSISGVSAELGAIYDRLSEAMYTIEDAAHEIKEFSARTEYDPAELNDIMERLDLISRLRRKYGATVADIIAHGAKAQSELDGIANADERTQELRAELKESLARLKAAGTELSRIRKTAARELGTRIEKALSELDMEKAKFNVRVEDLHTFGRDGINRVEFMISTNPGEPMKPLVKIASGGELSRVMLAMKSVLSESDSVETMIFDEIDTGVSGSAAVRIAKKLRTIAADKQVICITHLPQLTAAADNHYRISKAADGDMASTTLTELDREGRIDEIARIIDGAEATETAKTHAERLLSEQY